MSKTAALRMSIMNKTTLLKNPGPEPTQPIEPKKTENKTNDTYSQEMKEYKKNIKIYERQIMAFNQNKKQNFPVPLS